MAFYRTFPFSAPQPQSLPSPSIEGRRLRFASLTTLDRCGCRHKDCALRLVATFARNPPFRKLHYVFGRVACNCVHKLFALNSTRLIPTPFLRQGVGRVSSTGRSATYTCFSDLSMTVCSSPNSNVRGRHTCIPFLPPIEVTAAYIPRPRLRFIHRLRRCGLPSVTHSSYALTGREVVAVGR